MGMKYCTKCLKVKPIEEFYRVNNKYYRNECKTCTKHAKRLAYELLTNDQRAKRVHEALVRRHMSKKPSKMITEAFVKILEIKGYSAEYKDEKIIFSINDTIYCYIRNKFYTELVFTSENVLTTREFLEGETAWR